MPRRKEILAAGEFYHIVNRGINRMDIFEQQDDYHRFTDLMDYYRFEELSFRYSHLRRLPEEKRSEILENLEHSHARHVKIVCHCLMSNHFHLLLHQVSNTGIYDFMRNLENSYAKYFNTKYSRVGPLFQSAFNVVRIESEGQLIHVSRYIHINPTTAYLVKRENLESYEYSSLPNYLGRNLYRFVETDVVLANFKTIDEYRKFVFNQIDYQRKLARIKHLLLE